MKKFLGQLLSNYQTVSERKAVLIALSYGQGRDPFLTYLTEVGCWGSESKKIFVEEVLFVFIKATAATIRESAKLFAPTLGNPFALCEEGLRDYVIAMLIDPTGQTFLKFGEELGKLPLDSFEGKLDAILNLRNEARNWGVLLSRGSYAKFFLSDYAANENAIPNAFCREMSRVLAKYFCEQLPTCEHSHPSGEGKDKWATVFRAYEKIMVAYGFWFLPLLDGNLQNRLCDEHLTQLRTLTQPRVKDGELNQQPASQESAIVEPDLSSDSYSIWIKEIGESIDGGL